MKENGIRGCYRIVAVLITVLMCLTIFSRTLWADTGPKRSIDIEIKNAPDEPYYVALLDNGGYTRDINDRPGCDHIPEGEDCRVNYNYMVPSTFKVMVVTQSGKVSVSNEITAQAFYAEFEYDYATNKIIEVGGFLSNIDKDDDCYERYEPDYAGLAVESLIYLAITLTVEGLVLLCFRLFTKKNLKAFFIVNIATQLMLFAYNLFCLIFEPMLRSHFQYWFAVEAVIMLIEVLWYRKKLVNKQGNISAGRNIAYGITANLISMFIDFPIIYFIVEVLH